VEKVLVIMKIPTGITAVTFITHTMMVHMAAHITGTGTIGMHGYPTGRLLGPTTQYMDIKNQTVTTVMLNHQETVTTITCIITALSVGMMGIPMPTMDIQAIHIPMHLLILVPMLTTITTVQVALTQMLP
jgi:hypothetical protein